MKTVLFVSRPFVFAFSLLSIFLVACVSHDPPDIFDCATTDLAIELVAKSNPVRCDTDNGTVEVSADGGTPPYLFRLDSSSFGSLSLFSDLGAGSFIVTVKDARGCEKQLTNIALAAPNGPIESVSTISHQTNCTDPNGSITANVTGGILPYQYKIGKGSFANSATFSDLQAGLYTITVKDAAACTTEIDEIIERNTGVSYVADIKPILEANCIKSGCHNGDNGDERNWRFFTNVQAKAAGIKARTENKSMPPDINSAGLPQNEIVLIACWVNEGAQNN